MHTEDPWDAPLVGAPAGSPVDAAAVNVGGPLEWLEIHADGTESSRRGRVWAVAPPLQGMRAWWVLPGPPAPAPLAAPCGSVLVVRASRRAQVGRNAAHGRWRPRAGRFVDVGTLYVETAPASPQGALLALLRAGEPSVPTRIRVRPLDEVNMKGLSGFYMDRPALGINQV